MVWADSLIERYLLSRPIPVRRYVTLRISQLAPTLSEEDYAPFAPCAKGMQFHRRCAPPKLRHTSVLFRKAYRQLFVDVGAIGA
jgi:hypothetical protein